jgi:hypothetical protein
MPYDRPLYPGVIFSGISLCFLRFTDAVRVSARSLPHKYLNTRPDHLDANENVREYLFTDGLPADGKENTTTQSAWNI